MGGFAGKQRRQKSARAIAAKLLKAGKITKDEATTLRARIRTTGTLGSLRDSVKLKDLVKKRRGTKRNIYDLVETPQPLKVKKKKLKIKVVKTKPETIRKRSLTKKRASEKK